MTPSKRPVRRPDDDDWLDLDEAPPYVAPRYAPTAIVRFCDLLTEHLDGGYVGVANKVMHSDDRPRPGGFSWCTPEEFSDEVRHLNYRVGRDALAAWLWLYDGPRKDCRPAIETLVRLGVCNEEPTGANGWPRGGKVSDLCAVLGLSVDLDVFLRREGDRRRYCPDFDQAIELLDDLAPTLAIDGGGGMPTEWLFSEPCRDIEAARDLGTDLVETVAQRCAERGWDFDSPAPLTAWCKVPGTWSSKYRRVVEVLDQRERVSFDALRAAIPRYERHHWHGYGAAISRPSHPHHQTEGHRSQRLSRSDGGHRRRR